MRETRVTVVETKAFTGRAKGRMSAVEVDRAIEVIARDPLCGDLIQGTGGVRIVYYYCNESMPVFLLTVFAKNEKADLTRAERNALGKVARALRESYGA